MDAKRDLARFEKWRTITKMLSGAFLAILVVSILSATQEYYTMQHNWLLPSSIAFDLAVIMSALLAVGMNIQLRRKEQAIDSLKAATASKQSE